MKKDLETILSFTRKEGDCLIWTRCLNYDGYPRAVIDGNENAKIHRVVFELSNSEDIQDKVIRHKCDTPSCINPAHLVSGTPLDNIMDRDSRERQHRVLKKEQIFVIASLLANYPGMLQKEIAAIAGVDPRRVSDVKLGKYCSATGKFLGHG